MPTGEISLHGTLPGLMHVDHVALTLPDLEQGIRFYHDVFGATELYRLGPFDARELQRYVDRTQMQRRAVIEG